MRTAIATLIVALAAGTAQAEAEPGPEAEEAAAQPETAAAVAPPEEDAEVGAEDEPGTGLVESECLGSPVPVRRLGVRGSIWVHLADCKGQPFQAAEQALSALAVPLVPRAEESVEDREDELGADAQPRINPELLLRLQRVAERYPGRTIEIVSGYRTRASAGSRHRHFDALDITIEGVSNEELSAFARTFEATGVGYYPNSSFVHLDVREVAAYWVDESGPGEPAKYARKEAVAPTVVAEAVAAAEPVAAEPGAAEPVAAEPGAAEPVAAEPIVAEPAVVAEPAATAEPVTTQPTTSAPVTAEPAAATPAAAPAASPTPDSPQLASIAERALVVMKRALGRAGVQDTAL